MLIGTSFTIVHSAHLFRSDLRMGAVKEIKKAKPKQKNTTTCNDWLLHIYLSPVTH